jgi:tRNA(fMet)-specific endonuclease VapC
LPYLIDTNIAIHAIDGEDRVIEKLIEHDGEILISVLSVAELQRGVYKHPLHSMLRKARMEILLRNIPILPFDTAAAEAYGQIIAQCGWVKGRDFDRMIAGHALATASIMVTANTRDFRDVPGLVVEDWGV